MESQRIVCTIQEPANQPPQHAHIVSVGIGTTKEHYNQILNLPQVLQMMDQGVVFFTYGDNSQKTARVEKYLCSYCHKYHIKSSPDAVTDNNLDNLNYCKI